MDAASHERDARRRRGLIRAANRTARPPMQVEVQVIDRLTAPPPDVGDEPIAGVGDALGPGDVGGDGEQPTESSAASASVRSSAEAMCRRGMRRMWVGARGRDVADRDDQVVLVDAGGRDLARDDPAEQAVGRVRRSVGHRASSSSPEHRLRAHQEPDGPDEPGHQVRHVALALGALLPDPVVGRGLDPDQRAAGWGAG